MLSKKQIEFLIIKKWIFILRILFINIFIFQYSHWSIFLTQMIIQVCNVYTIGHSIRNINKKFYVKPLHFNVNTNSAS